MNRATRRATKKPARIPHFKAAHLQRLEQGYDSHAFAKVANRDVPAHLVQEQTTKARQAWQLLSSGQPAPIEQQATAWKLLAQLCNVTRVRADQIAQATTQQSAQQAEQTELMLLTLSCAESDLRAMQTRNSHGGNFTPTATALSNIPQMLDLHEQILSLSTTLQMQKALEAVLAAQIAARKKLTAIKKGAS